MATYSIWGTDIPDGNYAIYANDGFSIAVGNKYQAISPGIPGGKVIGAKIWIPANATTVPSSVRVFYHSSGAPSGTPTIEKTVPVTAAPGNWQAVLFDSQIPLSTVSIEEVVSIGYEFPGTDLYIAATTGTRPNTNRLQSKSGANLAWVQHNPEDVVSGNASAFYRIPANNTSPNNSSQGYVSYGIDILVSDGGDVEPPEEVAFGENIVEENLLDGAARASWFDGVGTEAMPAFERKLSNAPGDTVQFSVNYNSAFNVEIYRLGYYGGMGARKVDSFAGTPASQPTPVAIPNSNGAVTCAAWSVNAQWQIPSDALPGWYYALLKGQAGAVGQVLFCVSDVANKQPILVVSSDTTWHAAYNGFGGNNVYGADKAIGSTDERAFCSTYNKPVITRDYVPQTHFFNGEYATIKFFERIGAHVGYATLEQIEADPTVMDGRSLIVFSGHNEYISDKVMNKTKALLNAGQNFLNLAGNDFFWRIKFTNGDFTSATSGRNMWCKKDTMNGPGTHVGGTPFTTAAEWTGTWQDSRWTNKQPSWEFFGDRFIANGIREDNIKVPASMKSLPLWRHCSGIQSLTSGSFDFGAGTAGMEWDYPYGSLNTVKLSASSVSITNGAADINGQGYFDSGVYEHAIAITKPSANSGIVMNFNTTQWGWALDNHHLRGSSIAKTEAQQATVNALVDLGGTVDPASVATAGLTMPTKVGNLGIAYGLVEAPTGTVKERLHALGYDTYVIVQM